MPKTPPPAGDPEAARIIALVSSIMVGADLRRFDLVEAAFDTEVLIDYTSLWGGDAQTLPIAAILAGWQALLPGFDATRHELSGIAVAIDGDGAAATAQIDARHWLGGGVWRLLGDYSWRLTRRRHGWKITAMALQVDQELGDRGLVHKATERAARHRA